MHKSDRDDYSDTVEKGYIVTHGYASDYVKGEGFNYGLSLGKKSGSDTTKITVNANKYVGSSENDFKSAMTNLKLNAKQLLIIAPKLLGFCKSYKAK